MQNYFEFVSKVKILAGEDALSHLPFELNLLEAKKPLILSDEMIKNLGLLEKIFSVLNGKDFVTFTEITPDSSVELVNEISKLYLQNNCDSIIAIGGGSVLDTAKAVNILASKRSENLLDFLGLDRISGRLNPLIAIPTTAGTGSEATKVAVILSEKEKTKLELISSQIIPDVAILDPVFTETLPLKVTVATAIDAFTHSIEALYSLQKNPISDSYAITSIKLIYEFLPAVIRNPKNREARLNLAIASFLAGAAFSNSMVGIIHAVGHSLGALHRIPHGNAMALLLTHGMKINSPNSKKIFSKILLNIDEDEFIKTSEEKRTEKLIQLISEFIKKLSNETGLKIKLSEYEISKKDFEKIAEKALNDGAVLSNPIPVTKEIIIQMLEMAY